MRKNSDVTTASSTSSSKPSRSFGKTILTWVGWGIVYVFVFYLGNVSGEYVAAHLPILPSLPRISINTEKMKSFIPVIVLPKISVAWKWPTFSRPSSVQTTQIPHTKLVIVRGQFINMPVDTATDDERKTFVEAIDKLAVDAREITISESCEMDPPFIRVKQGEKVALVSNVKREHAFMFDKTSEKITPKQTISVPLAQNQGAYAISCDGSVVGFYRVY